MSAPPPRLLRTLVGAITAAVLGCTPQADTGAEVGGTKEGGALAIDLNEDGCPDLVVNAHAGSFLLHGNCASEFPTYLDVTATHASGMSRVPAERSVVAADLNNDGTRDVVRDTSTHLEVFLNGGPTATPPYRLGTETGDPDRVFSGGDFEAGANLEGVAILDYDADGWLDLAVQNAGIELLRNPGDGTANFTVATTAADAHGLPRGLNNGDYAAAADVDSDGDVDLLVRNVGAPSLWLNDGAGQFTASTSFTPSAADPDLKSGVAVCDLDADGDLDLYWGGVDSARPDELWVQGPDAVFTQASPPNGGSFSTDVACADGDGDGDLDVALAHAGGIRVLENTGGLTFAAHELEETTPAYAIALADLDLDGDVDLYANRADANVAYRNVMDLKHARVSLRTSVPGRSERDALGASARLMTCDGAPASARLEVNGGRGHGTQDAPILHFGIPETPALPRLLEARFVGGKFVRRAFDSASLPGGATVIVRESDGDLFYSCNTPSIVRIADAPNPHSNGASSLLPDGRVLYFGGAPVWNATDLLDPFLGTWTPAGSSADDHGYVGAVTLPTGEVVSVDTGGEPCILFSPVTATWRRCDAVDALRDVYQLLALPDGRALYAGGSGPAAVVDVYDPLLDAWTPQPPMATARSEFAGALLDDGTVLVVGGNPATDATERRELDGDWTDGTSLPDVATSPCLVRLWDGRVLAGGPDRSVLYEPATRTWRNLTGTGTVSICGASGLLPDGRVASLSGLPATVWLFDPLTETWQPGPPFRAITLGGMSAILPTGRWAVLEGGVTELLDPGSERWSSASAPPMLPEGATLTLLSSGEALLAGGAVGGVATTDSWRRAVTGSWTASARSRMARSGHRATLLAEGRVLVTGGTDTAGAQQLRPELYDPRTDTWTLLEPVDATGTLHTVTPLLDGRALLVAGAAATLFDPATLRFGAPIPLPRPRSGHTATRLLDGRVLLASGEDSSADLFDPATGAVTPTGALTTARSGAAAVLMPGGQVFVAGSGTAELWDPATGAWTSMGTLATPRTGHGALLLRNGKILLFGGTPAAEPELFDPLAKTGRPLPSGIVPSATAGAIRLGNGTVLLVTPNGARVLDEGRSGLSRAPQVTSAALDGGTLVVAGEGWMSAPQGSDGQMRSASANIPVLFVERPDTQELRPAPMSSWTNQGGIAPYDAALGTTNAFVAVTGVPSASKTFQLGLAGAECATPTQCATGRCEASTCCQTCADGTCRTDGCPGGELTVDAGVDAGADAGTTDAGSGDGGVFDAGPGDAGTDAGQQPAWDLQVGCGCGAGGLEPALFGLLLLAARALSSRSSRRTWRR